MGSKELGDLGEDIAFHYLKKKGYKVLFRNYRTKHGEIDLIAKKKGTLVFVEVKYGSREAYLRVNVGKFRRIATTAEKFIEEHGDFGTKRYFVDVISIDKNGEVLHFENVAKDFWR